jgi:hypothetical protein
MTEKKQNFCRFDLFPDLPKVEIVIYATSALFHERETHYLQSDVSRPHSGART